MRERVVGILGFAVGVIIALTIIPLIVARVSGNAAVEEIPFWGTAIVDLLVLSSGFVLARLGCMAAKIVAEYRDEPPMGES